MKEGRHAYEDRLASPMHAAISQYKYRLFFKFLGLDFILKWDSSI